MHGKCPSCGNIVMKLNGDAVDASFGTQSYKATTYNCPMCNVVLGCQIDPLAVRNDIVAQVVDELFKRLGK